MRHGTHRTRKTFGMLELNMTAMCDVAFLLLIYLLLTATPPKVLANLSANRPTGVDPRGIQPMIEIMVFRDAFVVDGKRVNANGLKNVLNQLADMDKTQGIAVKCAWDSPHEKLIEVLDMCAGEGLNRVSILSM